MLRLLRESNGIMSFAGLGDNVASNKVTSSTDIVFPFYYICSANKIFITISN